jgi:hypothetical protein
MEKYGNKQIKELVKDFPEILDVLAEFKIPCATCKMHNCTLNQVAEAEDISMENEVILYEKINAILNSKK